MDPHGIWICELLALLTDLLPVLMSHALIGEVHKERPGVSIRILRVGLRSAGLSYVWLGGHLELQITALIHSAFTQSDSRRMSPGPVRSPIITSTEGFTTTTWPRMMSVRKNPDLMRRGLHTQREP